MKRSITFALTLAVLVFSTFAQAKEAITVMRGPNVSPRNPSFAPSNRNHYQAKPAPGRPIPQQVGTGTRTGADGKPVGNRTASGPIPKRPQVVQGVPRLATGTMTDANGKPVTNRPTPNRPIPQRPEVKQGVPRLAKGTMTDANGKPVTNRPTPNRPIPQRPEVKQGVQQIGTGTMTGPDGKPVGNRPTVSRPTGSRPTGGPAFPGVRVVGGPAPRGTYSQPGLTGSGPNPFSVFTDTMDFWGNKVGIGSGSITPAGGTPGGPTKPAPR